MLDETYRPPSATLIEPTPRPLVLGRRLAATLFDQLALAAPFAPIVVMLAEIGDLRMTTFIAASALLLMGVCGLDLALIAVRNRTIGKLVFALRVVRSNGERVSFPRYVSMRIAPVWAINRIPASEASSRCSTRLRSSETTAVASTITSRTRSSCASTVEPPQPSARRMRSSTQRARPLAA